MKTNNEYTKKSAFINRKKELQFLHDHIAKTPENMLFIYGPKSSGKTTLINKFIDIINLDKTKKYEVKHFNLREISIDSYDDFIQTFFLIDRTHEQNVLKTKKTKSLSVNFQLFAINRETEKLLHAHKVDPFHLMKEDLQKLQSKNIRSIVIIDELQALEGIYMKDKKELIKGILNFFVAMTKESHLCHVLIASADGYFIERIFEDSKLKKTSTFFEVEYLTKEDTLYWLNNLEKESAIKNYTLTQSQKETIWDFFGGSCWEVSNFLGEIQNGAQNGTVPQDFFDIQLNKYKIMQRSKFVNYVQELKHKKLFFVMNSVLKNKGIITVDFIIQHLEAEYTIIELKNELQILVTKNILSFNPTTAEYALQGRSMEIGLEEFAKMQKSKNYKEV